jgi:hypothetical protein
VSHFAVDSGRNSFEVFSRNVEPSRTLLLPLRHDRQFAGPSCGAHALAPLIFYWTHNDVTGGHLYKTFPPAAGDGYSLVELLDLARKFDLQGAAVRLDNTALQAELNRGRPVIVPVEAPLIYFKDRTLPGLNAPVIGVISSTITHRAARLAELTDAALVNHYLVAVGFTDNRFIVLEPILGFRTISEEKLARYRRPFSNAALVISRNGDSSHRTKRAVALRG